MLRALRDLSKDTLTYGLADAIGKVVGFLLLPLYTSYLTPQDYGIISMLAFTYTFFSPIASLGITNAVFRRFNLHKDRRTQDLVLSTGGYFVVTTSTLLWILGITIAPTLSTLLIEDLNLIFLTEIALTGCLFSSIGNIFTVVLRATRKVKLISTILLFKLIFTICLTILLVVIQDLGVIGVIISDAVGALLSTIILAFHTRSYFKITFSMAELRAMLSYGLPFLPHKLFGTTLVFLGAYFIKEIGSLSDTGLYNIATKMAMPLGLLISSVQKSWVPIKFQVHRNEETSQRRATFKHIISIYFIVVTSLYIGLLFVGPEIIRVLTASDYHDAVLLFPIVLLTKISTGTYFMMGTGFEYTENTKPMPLISLAGLLTLLISVGPLSNWLGIQGVLIALTLANFVMSIVMRRFAVARFYVPLNWAIVLASLSIAVILSGVATFVQTVTFEVRIIAITAILIAVTVLGVRFYSLYKSEISLFLKA